MKEVLLIIFLLISSPSEFQLLGDYTTVNQMINYHRAIQYLPDELFNLLSYHNWKLNFIDDIDEVYPHAIGYYNTALKEVYVDDKKIRERCNDVDLTIQETIVHEFVHAFDYEQDKVSCMIYNPLGVKSDEVFAYSMTDWLFGKPVCEEHEAFFQFLFKDFTSEAPLALAYK